MSLKLFLELIGVKGNPFSSLGSFYRVFIVAIFIANGISATGQFLLAYSAYLTIDTKVLEHLIKGYQFMGFAYLASALTLSVFALTEAYLLYKAGEYTDSSLLTIIGFIFGFITLLNLLFTIPFITSTFFTIANYLKTQGSVPIEFYYNYIGFALISVPIGLIGFIGIILYLKFIYDVNSDEKVKEAGYALILWIIQYAFNLISYSTGFPSAYIFKPVYGYASGVLNFTSTIFSALYYYYLSQMFIVLGGFYDNMEKNPDILEEVIQELSDLEKSVDLRDLARERGIPFKLFNKKVKEKVSKGELAGSVIGYIYYPPKRKES